MRLRVTALLIAGCILTALFGCTVSGNDNTGVHVGITYLQEQNESDEGEPFLTVDRVTSETDRGKLVLYVLDELNKPPYTACISPFKDGAEVASAQVDGNSVTVDMTSAYQKLPGIQKSLIEASLVQSLCSIDGVDYVRITSDRKPVEGRRDHYLSSFDLVTSPDVFTLSRYDATLYLPDKGQDTLFSERSMITPAENETLEQAIVKAALGGMVQSSVSDPIIPNGTKLLSAEIKNAVCYLNFSGEFLSLDMRYGNLVIYSFVDSLCKLEYIRGVQLLIDGKPVRTLSGINVSGPLEADYSIVDN